MTAVDDPRVQAAFDALAPAQRGRLLEVREVVLAVADQGSRIGPLTETLKWDQPSYLPLQSGSGTTVRLGRFDDSHVALFVHCQTSLVQTWRERFPHLEYSGTRALLLDPAKPLPAAEIEECVELALTYKLRKSARARP